MEVTPVVNVFRFDIDDGIVAGRVDLIDQYFFGINDRFQHRSEHLWHTAEGVILLDFMFKDFNLFCLAVVQVFGTAADQSAVVQD